MLSAREQDLLKGIIKQALTACSTIPGGGGGSQTPVVTVTWRMNEDGTVAGEPVVQHPQNSQWFGVAAEASVRAVKNCQPFNLPKDKYSSWREITWDFDWPKILGTQP